MKLLLKKVIGRLINNKKKSFVAILLSSSLIKPTKKNVLHYNEYRQ